MPKRIICEVCGKELLVKPSLAKKKRFCSIKCKFVNYKPPSRKGQKHTMETRERMSIYRLKNPNKYWLGKKRTDIAGANHYRWSKNPAYRAIHQWIQKVLGKAKKCSECGKEGGGRQFHWANRQHKYTRNSSDYIELCARCHGEYDKKNNLRKKYA